MKDNWQILSSRIKLSKQLSSRPTRKLSLQATANRQRLLREGKPKIAMKRVILAQASDRWKFMKKSNTNLALTRRVVGTRAQNVP